VKKLICFDCDSTLSGIEGIDELAYLRGEEVFAQVKRMTSEAMDGGVALEDIFAQRLELIRPSAAEIDRIAHRYLVHIEPDADSVFHRLRGTGWETAIISGGFRRAIRPLAERLEVGLVEAVDLFFDTKGRYMGFAGDCQTTRTRGKNTVIAALKARLRPDVTVMVGDGASDLETAPDVSLFVGFGRYVERKLVREGAGLWLTRLTDLPDALAARGW
jgi:phosphoserine phosphatase